MPEILFNTESRVDNRGWQWIRTKIMQKDFPVAYSDWMVFDQNNELLMPRDLEKDEMWQALHEAGNYVPIFACDKNRPYLSIPLLGDINVDELVRAIELLEVFWEEYGLSLLMMPELLAIDARHDNIFQHNRALTADELYSIFQKKEQVQENLDQKDKPTDKVDSTNDDTKQDLHSKNDSKEPKDPKFNPWPLTTPLLLLWKVLDIGKRFLKLVKRLLLNANTLWVVVGALAKPIFQAIRVLYIGIVEPHNLEDAIYKEGWFENMPSIKSYILCATSALMTYTLGQNVASWLNFGGAPAVAKVREKDQEKELLIAICSVKRC